MEEKGYSMYMWIIDDESKGEEWAKKASPILVNVNRQIRELEEKKEKEVSPYKEMIREIEGKYRGQMEELQNVNKELRERIVEEIKSTDTIHTEDGGKVVFMEELVAEPSDDTTKIDKNYLTISVDMKKVRTAIKSGIRKIKGIEIKPKVSVRVYTNPDGSY